MAEAISDTGPILHLHEIGFLEALGSFDSVTIPDLVADELERFGLSIGLIGDFVASQLQVTSVEDYAWRSLEKSHERHLQPADAQVLALAIATDFRTPVLTDDLKLRRTVEHEGGLAVGSIGILVKNHHQRRIGKSELEKQVEQLIDKSSLHMSRPFRRYVRRLIREIE